MAGSMYRAGVAAASEIKEQYNNTRTRGLETPEAQMSIPGSFPNVAIVTRGDDQMVLFPSYAKRHVREHREDSFQGYSAAQMGMSEEEYWRHEWAKNEDAKAVVDVDVRGWIYTPHKGPMTRRNRVLIGLARRLSGIPPPTMQTDQVEQVSLSSHHDEHERLREEQKIMKEAQEIERKGQGEKEVANRGGYSEAPKDEDDLESNSLDPARSCSGSQTPASAPSSPTLAARTSWAQPAELTEAELAVANANLMARLGPFLTTPLVQLAITVFFYNDNESQSRTVLTNDAGHFVLRAALDFVPTHVRVLANENLSATEKIQLIEPRGISLISDIDDTIKHSNISLGAREIFRNTFIRDLADLTVDGVQEWYNKLHDLGVRMHYCSNSPWQLFPVIATFFHIAGLPPGSIHLKQYSGMLQGIFEPVAERKKGTLEKILRDFPQRKFLLVGDSGEADLEVYTDLAVANPGRILALFIRDVTTPEQVGYFDTTFGGQSNGRRSRKPSTRIKFEEKTGADNPESRPPLPPRFATEPSKPQGPAMGTLIDFSDEPEPMGAREARDLNMLKAGVSNLDLLSQKPPPPPRPAKPPSLRGVPSNVGLGISDGTGTSAPANARGRTSQHPLAQMHNLSDQTIGSTNSLAKAKGMTAVSTNSAPAATNPPAASSDSSNNKPPPPPPRRRNTPSSLLKISPRLLAQRRTISNGDELADLEALPGAAYSPGSPTTPPLPGAMSPINRKVDLWRRRLARAHEILDHQGVALYTWRKGEDVIHEAEGIVKAALEAIERRGR
ncbi:actin patch protein 1 [Thozetella sp. PMI_491]|nr:actin patch protein 1 [Thozetella sp. PMI_491]